MEPQIKDLIRYEYKLDSTFSNAILNNTFGEPITNIHMPIPKQYLGIEIEVEQITNPNKIRNLANDAFYNITNDGSLRNNGIEIITKPVTADCIETLLTTIYKALPTVAEFSPRTSIHVHMNIRNLTFQELTGVIYTYIAVEKLLYNFIGTNRNKSIFCVPIQETDLPICLNNFLTSQNTRYLGWFKYTGMNLLPILKLGTIEFRHLHGTRDVGLILKWISILQHIFAYAINNKIQNITENILSINSTSTYRIFIEDIFKEHTKDLIYSNFDRDLEQGVSYLKTYVFSNEFLTNLQSRATKTSPLYKRLYKENKSPIYKSQPVIPDDPQEEELIPAPPITAGAKKPKKLQVTTTQLLQQQALMHMPQITPNLNTAFFTTTNIPNTGNITENQF